MRRLKLWATIAALGISATTTQVVSADEVSEQSVSPMTVQPVGFWLHGDGCSSNSCDGCDAIDDCCADSCDGCSIGCGGDLLGGLIKPSDACFNDFISPMINFVHFEDPRTLTEIRPIFVNHWVPDNIGNNVSAGGEIQLFALQFRAALTENLSLIAVKDGFIVDNTDGTLDALLGDGWADVTAGLKYNFLRDECTGTLASAGFTYELPIGSDRALQDVGDGQFHLFASAGQRLLDGDAHLLTTFGWRIPVDGDVQNEAVHWSSHIDFRLTEKAYVFTEFAWWHFVNDPNTPLIAGAGVAGQDLFDLPFSGVEGKNLVTQAVGVKVKPTDKTEVGVAYEFPISDFRDVIDSRLMLDLIIRY